MKINRLFGIVYILLDRGRITAKELAAHFEVSVRTIYRDVEALSTSGVPIYMSKGRHGGIDLMPDYVLNKTLLSEQERQEILSALHSLKALKANSLDSTLSRLSALFGGHCDSIFEIDFHDWGSLLTARFELARQAILCRRLLAFDYISSQNITSHRTVEPSKLWFKDRTWYLKAFCLDRQALRVFRFSRMQNAHLLEDGFVPRAASLGASSQEPGSAPTVQLVMRVEAPMKYRLLDEFPAEAIQENRDGSFTIAMEYIEDAWLHGYILSFGPWATVIRPEHIREAIINQLKKNLANYI